MKKKKKQSCSCTSQYETCKPCEPVKATTKKCEDYDPCETITEYSPISSCKPCSTEKNLMASYVDCPSGDYEITCVDKCVELAKKAEELFDKACKYEANATNAFNQAKECEKSAKLLSQKACNLLQNANKFENQAKDDECRAKELMQKAKDLFEKARALNKEAESIENDAKSSCERAKALYEKAETYNEKAKCLYNQALKYDEKALECYKTAGDKIKEYENKSKKCEDMIDKCGSKLKNCENNCVSNKYEKDKMMDMYIPIASNKHSSGCMSSYKNPCESVVDKTYKCDDEIIYIDMDNCTCNNQCSSYVSPMYNMAPMQCMGNFSNKYPSLDNCDMNNYDYEYDDMWMNYYMYMQKMMQQMPYNK
ncbi:hypothetical protein [Terrisporobacter sp.]